MLDATTFLLLNTGSLIHKCSPGFFVLLGCPAIVAVVFVGMGRCHLTATRRRTQRMQDTFSATETQPLNVPLFQGSHDEDDEDNPGPIPTIATQQSGDQASSEEQEEPSTAPLDFKWVLFLPLASAFAGIMNAFQHRPSNRRRRRRNSGNPDHDQDVSMPLLDHWGEVDAQAHPNNSLFLSTSDNSGNYPNSEDDHSQHDNFKSLLAWWLPGVSVLIGLLSALLGIGGGELLGPILLLLLKMDPQQSSATTAIMSLMNSGTNLLHYIVADMMMAPGYAINLGLAGLIGGSGGRMWAISMAQHGRTSIIAMSLCGVLSLATALVVWELFTTPVSWESSPDVC